MAFSLAAFVRLAVLFVFALTVPLTADQIDVRPGGLAAAAGSARPGDELVLADGVYVESFKVGLQQVAIRAANRGGARIIGTLTFNASDQVVLDGLDIEGTVALISDAPFVNAHGQTIDGRVGTFSIVACSFHGSDRAITADAPTGPPIAYVLISGCSFRDHPVTALVVSALRGKVERCDFDRCGGGREGPGGYTGGAKTHVIYATDGSGPWSIVDCTFRDCVNVENNVNLRGGGSLIGCTLLDSGAAIAGQGSGVIADNVIRGQTGFPDGHSSVSIEWRAMRTGTGGAGEWVDGSQLVIARNVLSGAANVSTGFVLDGPFSRVAIVGNVLDQAADEADGRAFTLQREFRAVELELRFNTFQSSGQVGIVAGSFWPQSYACGGNTLWPSPGLGGELPGGRVSLVQWSAAIGGGNVKATARRPMALEVPDGMTLRDYWSLARANAGVADR
ncbi:MAG: hypothetical protein ACKVW3_13060 [Phycisphaerales bacterium]